ncbi:TPA: klaC [Salmonella enterica subsp. enterica serovar 16:l,v:-]
MPNYEDLGQEVAALDQRSKRMSKTGIIMLFGAAGTFVLGGVGFILSRLFRPEIKSFVIDVPHFLIPAAPDSAGSILFDAYSPLESAIGFLTNPVLLVIPVVGAGFLAMKKFMTGEGSFASFVPIMAILPLILFGKVFSTVFDDGTSQSSADAPSSIIRDFIKEDKTTELVAYLKKNEPNPTIPKFMEYVTAQVSIKQNKPDLDTIRRVVGYYRSQPDDHTENANALTVPADIRYALEITGFNKTVTALASRYEQGKMKKVRFFSQTSSGAFTLATFLLCIGGALYLWGSQLKRRVSFIREIALK